MAIAWPACATAGQLELGFGLAQPGYNPTFQPWAVGTTLRLGYQHPLSSRWSFAASGTHQRFLNDTSSTSTIKFSFPNEHADQRWQLWALDLGAQFYMSQGSLRPYLRGTVGAAFWDVKYLNGDPISVTSAAGGQTDFSAQEVALSSALGLCLKSGALGFSLEVEGTYLTGMGADFSDATDDMRSHALLGLLFKMSYDVGYNSGDIKVTSAPAAATGTAAMTAEPAGEDSDQDGVPDFVDRCEGTPLAAKGWVDVEGCPLDADRDGVADYLDRCRGSDTRWPVDSMGCVEDADSDGVPNVADRCPDTQTGQRVDTTGCPDYPPIKDTLVLRFEYPSGATRLDEHAQSQLAQLVPHILYNPTLKISICGYTDNLGATQRNLDVSQKRAQVVKDYFVENGIPALQLVATGKGETRPIATNETKEGRALNRRIEISAVR